MSTRRLPSPCPAGRLYPHLWLAFFVCIGFVSVNLSAQPLSDTLLIRFPIDSIRINMDFDDNGQRWAAFEHKFQSRYSHLPAGSLRMDIYSGASPEGLPSFNQWLGEQRGQAVRRLLRSHLGNSLGDIVVHNEGARWESFYDLVSASNEPWRDEVLRIIELPASTNPDQRDHREYKLRRLDGGRVWPILLERYLAPLRNGASAVLSWQGGGGAGGRDTIVIRETVVTHDTVFVINNYLPTESSSRQPRVKDAGRQARRDSLRREYLDYPAWAVKTNLLLWGVVAPNIEVELPLGRRNRWSLEAEYFVPWFIWGNNSRASQCHNLGVELRLWLGKRERRRWLEGWHIGLAAAVGYYDWEWKQHDGYQGEYVNTYLNIGYQHRWGKHWGLDCGIGAGIWATKYRHYYGGSVFPENHLEPWDEHLIWHDSGRDFWYGPCHANISIIYFINAWPLRFKSTKISRK